MKLYRPIETNFITQAFGENKACFDVAGKVYPILSSGTCSLNTKLLYPSMGMKGHNGEDWILYRGEPIYFPAEFEGWMKTEVDGKGGIGVDVISRKKIFNGNYIKLRFWHLQKVIGSDKKTIKLGDCIGLGNSTGLSSGDHLHWSVKVCDENGKAIEEQNGFLGARPFGEVFEVCTNKFILDVLTELKPTDTPQQVQMNIVILSLRKIILQLRILIKKLQNG